MLCVLKLNVISVLRQGSADSEIVTVVEVILSDEILVWWNTGWLFVTVVTVALWAYKMVGRIPL